MAIYLYKFTYGDTYILHLILILNSISLSQSIIYQVFFKNVLGLLCSAAEQFALIFE